MAATTSRPRSRSQDKIFLVGFSSHQITECKLPSKRQVLATLFYNLRTVKLNIKESARSTIQEVFLFWAKARIPTKYEKDAITKLEKLHTEWRNVRKDKNKKSEILKNKIKKFASELDDLFDIAHQDALNMMKLEEDKDFLIKQRQRGRPGSMSGVDFKLARAEERKLEKMPLEKRIETEHFDMETEDEEEECETEDTDDTGDDGLMDVCTSQDSEELPGPSHSKRMRGGREILTMKLSLLLDRCGLSDRNATRILIATVEALGYNPDDFIISKSAIYRKRKDRVKYTEEIMKKLNVPEKEAVVVHWDGKLLPHVLRSEQKERIAVLITYGENDQLLGVPLADSSTGEEQALAVYECLQEWGLTNCVKAMCFDTTASNTGRLKGACTILEQMLDKELLYFACRHHILEVVLRGVFEVKLGSTTGPHPDFFKKFEKAWPNIDKTKYDSGISNKNVEKHITAQFITEITADFKSKLTESQPRDDYRELLELVLVFVGTLDGREIGFKTPGAISHARWMAKAIYCLKIYLFRGQFQLTDKEVSALESICIFLVRVYCQAWFNSPKAHLAPHQDLNMLQTLIEFQETDKDMAERGLLKFSNHLWYLNSELVALALFDPTLPPEEKSRLATKIISEADSDSDESNENTRIINPKLQRRQIEELVRAGLSSLVTKETIRFLDRFAINTSFLEEDPTGWLGNDHYNEGLKIVKSLKVVNDCAERGVKLITDFNKLLTKDEEQKQFVLQVVAECRKLYPDASKRILSKPLS